MRARRRVDDADRPCAWADGRYPMLRCCEGILEGGCRRGRTVVRGVLTATPAGTVPSAPRGRPEPTSAGCAVLRYVDDAGAASRRDVEIIRRRDRPGQEITERGRVG